MSHLHFTDGIIAPVWCAVGYLLSAAVLAFCIYKMRGTDNVKRAPFTGLISALMLVTMSVPLGFIPFHLNLTVLLSIISGPYVGFIAVFIVNFILALIGHGGITVVGINTMIMAVEVFLGYAIFYLLSKKINVKASAFIAVLVALLVSASIMVGVVFATNAGIEHILPHQHVAGEIEGGIGHHADIHREANGFEQAIHDIKAFSFSGIAAIVAILALGIGLEAVVTLLIVAFFERVRPDLLFRYSRPC